MVKGCVVGPKKRVLTLRKVSFITAAMHLNEVYFYLFMMKPINGAKMLKYEGES